MLCEEKANFGRKRFDSLSLDMSAAEVCDADARACKIFEFKQLQESVRSGRCQYGMIDRCRDWVRGKTEESKLNTQNVIDSFPVSNAVQHRSTSVVSLTSDVRFLVTLRTRRS